MNRWTIRIEDVLEGCTSACTRDEGPPRPSVLRRRGCECPCVIECLVLHSCSLAFLSLLFYQRAPSFDPRRPLPCLALSFPCSCDCSPAPVLLLFVTDGTYTRDSSVTNRSCCHVHCFTFFPVLSHDHDDDSRSAGELTPCCALESLSVRSQQADRSPAEGDKKRSTTVRVPHTLDRTSSPLALSSLEH